MNDITTESAEPAVQVFPERLAILVDVHNLFCAAKLLHQSKVDYGNLLRGLTGTRQLVRAIAYVVHKPDVNQAGFHEALGHLGYEVKIKELKVFHDQEARGGTSAKGSWQVGLTIDALMLATKLDTIALVTGDGEYAPLVERLKSMGCRVQVAGFEGSVAGELARAADQFLPIQENWIFREKKFEELAANTASSPPATPTAAQGLLGSTIPGQVAMEGLPRDEEHPGEAPAMAAGAEGPVKANRRTASVRTRRRPMG